MVPFLLLSFFFFFVREEYFFVLLCLCVYGLSSSNNLSRCKKEAPAFYDSVIGKSFGLSCSVVQRQIVRKVIFVSNVKQL